MATARAKYCQGCKDQLNIPLPLAGVWSLPLRAVGIRRSNMNPNICTFCELGFKTLMRARQVTVDATILFADLRNYTTLSQTLSPEAVSGLLDTFYDVCAAALWEQDGLLNKTIGDAVMAVFNFPIVNADHTRRALRAARDIQRRCAEMRIALAGQDGMTGDELGVGIGIHAGVISFGEFGKSHRDVTAIGNVVNIAARAQSSAGTGEILVTREVRDRAVSDMTGSAARLFTLKGIAEPMELFAA